MKDHYFDICYCTKMRNVEKYNDWYFSWFLWEIEIILMNKWGKYINMGKFHKNVFYRGLCSYIVLKIFETKFRIFYDYWDFYGILKDKINEKYLKTG